MPRLPRIVTVLGAICAAALAPVGPVDAQLYGIHSGAANLATVDAAALGDTVRSSLGLFAAKNYVLAGGVGVLGGSLKGYVGSQPNRVGTPYALGVGYARTIAVHDLLGPLHGAIGTELVAGFRHMLSAPRDAGAVSLTAPVGLSLGDPSSSSLGFYAAPYVESGVMRAWERVPGSCTPWCASRLSDTGLRSAAGAGLDGRAALGRFALEVLVRDVRLGHRGFYGGDEGALGLTYRLSR